MHWNAQLVTVMHCNVPVAPALMYRYYVYVLYRCVCTINHLYYTVWSHYLEIIKDKSRPKVPKVTATAAKQRLGTITQLCRVVICSRHQQTLRLYDALLWHSLQYCAQFQSPSFKNTGSEDDSNFSLNLLKLRSRSSHFFFTSLEVTRQRNKHSRREATTRKGEN